MIRHVIRLESKILARVYPLLILTGKFGIMLYNEHTHTHTHTHRHTHTPTHTYTRTSV